MPRRRVALLIAAVLACTAFPAAAQAELITYGSDLSAPANSVEPDNGIHPNYGGLWYGADTAFWNSTLANGSSATAPADGQIVEFRVKGKALRGPGQSPDAAVLVHFQTLRPQPDGSLRVLLSSGEMWWPLDGDSQQITTVRPINHCIYAGDYVAFNTWGGHEGRFGDHGGVPLQIFSTVQGSSLSWFEGDNGTNNGAQFHAFAPRQNRELLMQAVLATGPDATDICPGGYQQHVFEGLEVQSPQNVTLRVKQSVARVRASCPGPTYGSCKGTLRLEASINGADVTLGSKRFDVAPATTTNIEVPIPVENVTLVQQARSLEVRAVAEGHDDPRAANEHDVPVQGKTTTANITLEPDLLGSRAGCAAARKAEKRAIKKLKAWKKRQKRAASSRARKAASKRVSKARRKAIRATNRRRAACA